MAQEKDNLVGIRFKDEKDGEYTVLKELESGGQGMI